MVPTTFRFAVTGIEPSLAIVLTWAVKLIPEKVAETLPSALTPEKVALSLLGVNVRVIGSESSEPHTLPLEPGVPGVTVISQSGDRLTGVF